MLASVPTVKESPISKRLIRRIGQIDRSKNRDERGAALAEWGLLVVLIAIVALIALSLAGQEVSGQYSTIASALTN